MGKVDNIIGNFAGAFNTIGIPLLIALLIPKMDWKSRIGIFFIIFVIIWILGLNVNPYTFENNNKYAILRHLPPEYLPKMRLIRNMEDIQYVYNAFSFPIIIKPTVCDGIGRRVVKVESVNQLFDWAEKNRAVFGSQRLTHNLLDSLKGSRRSQGVDKFMVQEAINGDTEIGVLVEKMPYEKYIRIVSIVEKTGTQAIRKGCEDIKCVMREDLIPILQPAIRKISSQIPNFNTGRYDIRSTEQDLLKGKFKICEVNGTGLPSTLPMGEPRRLMFFDLRSWVRNDALRSFYDHERWFFTRLWIGFLNIMTLRGYSPINLLRVMWTTTKNSVECADYENFYALYT